MRFTCSRTDLGLSALLACMAVSPPLMAQRGSDRTPSLRRTPYIVGGGDAPVGAYPWMTAIVTDPFPPSSLRPDANQTCGAVLVAEQWVLSAAHCIVNLSLDSFNDLRALTDNPGLLKVTVGASDLATVVTASSLRRIFVHPNYVTPTFDNDAALLQLAEPVVGVPSLALLTKDEEATLGAAGAQVTVIGWGRSSPPGNPTVNPSKLQTVDLRVVSNQDCAASWNAMAQDPSSSAVPITANMLCAADGAKGPCFGDSGGPLLMREGGGAWRFGGIVSFGTDNCDGSKPSVFTRVTAVSQWVNSCIAAGGRCPHRFLQCWDTNLNDVCDPISEDLDADGLCSTADCQGVQPVAIASSVKVSAEPKGMNCREGGQRIDSGLDSNRNGSLEGDEISSSSYVCNGQDQGGCGVAPRPASLSLGVWWLLAMAWVRRRKAFVQRTFRLP